MNSLFVFCLLSCLLALNCRAQDLKVAHHIQLLAGKVGTQRAKVSPSVQTALQADETDESRSVVFLEMKESLGQSLKQVERVWVRYKYSEARGTEERDFIWINEDQVWRANLGEFPHQGSIRYSVFVEAQEESIEWPHVLKRTRLSNDCSGKGCFVSLARDLSKRSVIQEKVKQASIVSKVISLYLKLNRLAAPLQKVEWQVESAKAEPVRPIEDDVKVIEFLSKHRIYVSLTTSPQRIVHLKHVLNTLDLDWVEKVFVALPERYGRDGSAYQIPQDLLTFPKVKFLRFGTDLGPISKLLPAAEYLQSTDPDAILITVDDDVAYPRGMIGEYVRAMASHRRTVVGMRGFDLSFWGISDFGLPGMPGKKYGLKKSRWDEILEGFFGRRHKEPRVEVLEGFAGIAYPVNVIDIPLFKHFARKDLFPECFISDDLVIGFGLSFSKVDRRVVSSKYHNIRILRPLQYGFQQDALHQGAGFTTQASTDPIALNAIKYQGCYERLMSEVFDPTTMALRSRDQVLGTGLYPMPSL